MLLTLSYTLSSNHSAAIIEVRNFSFPAFSSATQVLNFSLPASLVSTSPGGVNLSLACTDLWGSESSLYSLVGAAPLSVPLAPYPSGRFSPDLVPCACAPEPQGVCDSGYKGSGACTCQAGWTGAACDQVQPGLLLPLGLKYFGLEAGPRLVITLNASVTSPAFSARVTSLPSSGALFQTSDGSNPSTAITAAPTLVTDARRLPGLPSPVHRRQRVRLLFRLALGIVQLHGGERRARSEQRVGDRAALYRAPEPGAGYRAASGCCGRLRGRGASSQPERVPRARRTLALVMAVAAPLVSPLMST